MRIVSTFPSIHFSYLLWFFFHLFANSLFSILFLNTLIYFGNKVEKERIQTNVSVLFVCLFIYIYIYIYRQLWKTRTDNFERKKYIYSKKSKKSKKKFKNLIKINVSVKDLHQLRCLIYIYI